MTQGEQDRPEQTRAAGAPEALTFASGRYVATRLLGEGGQKRVYLGRDTQLHRDVAIAFIKAEGLDEAGLDRVRREAQTIASLGAQPNVITIFDVGEEEGRPYTVCEYAPGGALRQELRRADGPLPLERALAIARDVCQGLALAHAHGILHRDVKPENIWFTSAGTAKLGDFGLAVAFGQSRMTAPGTVLGTAAYMPPEQALGAEVDARGDLYSLGCVLYEMVTGRPPFSGDDAIAMVSQHVNSAPDAPSEHNRDVPELLDALIVRLLAKAPHHRPESAVAVLQSLSAIAAAPAGRGEAETAAVVTPAPKVRRKAPRPKRRTLVAGAALVVVAGVAVAATMAFALRDSGPAHNTAAGLPLVAEGYVPKLELVDCPADQKANDPGVRCQDLVVPEDRSKPTGRQVRVPVTFYPSRTPGTGITTLTISDGTTVSDVRDYGDSVLIGTRGQPSLTCPEVSGVTRQLLALPLFGPEANGLYLDAVEQCGKRLVSEGVNLDAYGQNDIADDVRDLAIVMGWHQINLQARSDWARIAVLLAARYPSLVRSVVLAEPFPIDNSRFNDSILNDNAALQAYYAACHDDAACEKAFPNLEQALPAVYAQYHQKPAVITVPDPNGGAGIDVMLDGDRNVDSVVDALVDQVALTFIASGVTSGFHNSSADATVAGFLVLNAGLDPKNLTPWGAWFSGYCEDQAQYVSTVAVGAAETAYPLFRVFAHDPWLELCDRWPTKERSKAIAAFGTVRTVPALILTGALDPWSPPGSAQGVAQSFKEATVVVFPRLTWDVLATPCVSALRLDFLRDPKAKLDIDGCIAKVPPIKFAGS